jgi:NAD(P)-dependent dehydrogenase (short-subunit alcohol dehydrogenase family)
MASLPDGLKGRLALVTGGTRGIGAAVVEQLRNAGCNVVPVGRSAQPPGMACDVTAQADVDRLAAACEPDILVNAAGAFGLAPVSETSVASFDRMLATNLRGPFLLIRALLPRMLARGSGHIVSIGSVAGRQAWPGNGAYSASKFGLRGLHAVLDTELKGTGVRATLVEPAATDTPLWDAVDRQQNPGLPAPGAMLQPQAVADAVLYVLTRPVETHINYLGLERS